MENTKKLFYGIFIVAALVLSGCGKGGDGATSGGATAEASPEETAKCKADKKCASSGLCTSIKGRCTVGSDADCAQSASCQNRGRCALVVWESFRSCGPTQDAHCKASEQCTKWGKCSLSKVASKTGHSCMALSDEDCAGSDQCTKFKRCSAKVTKMETGLESSQCVKASQVE